MYVFFSGFSVSSLFRKNFEVLDEINDFRSNVPAVRCKESGLMEMESNAIHIQLLPSVVSLLLEVTSIILPIRAMTTSSIPT